MHFCGDLLHDIPMYLMMVFPSIAAGIWWLRSKFLKKKNCSCDKVDHDHK